VGAPRNFAPGSRIYSLVEGPTVGLMLGTGLSSIRAETRFQAFRPPVETEGSITCSPALTVSLRSQYARWIDDPQHGAILVTGLEGAWLLKVEPTK